MLIVPIPRAKRRMALPFLSVVAPSQRFYKKKRLGILLDALILSLSKDRPGLERARSGFAGDEAVNEIQPEEAA
jgi:hypothetical protein